MISFTFEALCKALEFARAPQNANSFLRLYLEGKGCDGFYYGITFAEAIEDDYVIKHDIDGETLALHVDQETLQFVKGSTISWVDDERGRGFLVENPNQRQYRGKFYKKKVWLEHFAKKN